MTDDKALSESGGQSGKVSLVLQNAETIRLVDPQGKAIAVTSLKPGDKVLVHTTQGGRHFGMKVEESLIER